LVSTNRIPAAGQTSRYQRQAWQAVVGFPLTAAGLKQDE